MLSTLILALAATAAFAVPLDGPTKRDTPDLLTRLHNANSAVERTLILAEGGNASFTFDFTKPPKGAEIDSPGGKVVSANGQTFPFVAEMDTSLTVVTIAPCGLVAPHLHPRGDEFSLVTEGRILSQFITETGSIIVTNELPTYTATVFPKGSIHVEYNPDCTEAKFVAAFNNNDPGISLIAPNFFALNDEYVITTLGGETIFSGADLASVRNGIPKAVIYGVESCLKKCGIVARAKRSVAEVMGLEQKA
jgi:hypothetical protein